jgi:hypothetical protein
MVNAIGLKTISTPSIFTEILAPPAVAGAVYVAVQTPSVHVAAPMVPRVAVIVKSAGVAVVTTIPDAFFAVTVTVAGPLMGIEVGLTVTVDFVGSGLPAATTTTLCCNTVRTDESLPTTSEGGAPRTPVKVYRPGMVGGAHTTLATPSPPTWTESGATPPDTRNRTQDPAAATPLESSTVIVAPIAFPAVTLLNGTSEIIAGSTMTGT